MPSGTLRGPNFATPGQSRSNEIPYLLEMDPGSHKLRALFAAKNGRPLVCRSFRQDDAT